MRAGLIGLTGLFLIIGGAAQATVTESIRPQVRPGAGLVPVSAMVSADVPVRSLRPQARPEGAARVVLASGHGGFDRWIAGFRGRALAQGISARVFDRAFQGVRYDPEVVAKDRNQSEFKREIWDYLDSAVSPVRVENGQNALRQHRRVLDRIEAHYGVEKEVVTAVWGMESTYGARLGDLPLVQSMATLAFDGRRGAFFEKQLIAALQILQSGDVTPQNMTGSWAGAMGHTQFMPTSYLAYAVDFTGDGKRDIWSDDPTDALASTAAYLKRFGWRKGMPWGVEVQVPRGASFGDAKRMPSDWAAHGVVGLDGRAVRDHGSARIFRARGSVGAVLHGLCQFRRDKALQQFGRLCARGGAPLGPDRRRAGDTRQVAARLRCAQLWRAHGDAAPVAAQGLQRGKDRRDHGAEYRERHPCVSGFGRRGAGRVALAAASGAVAPVLSGLSRSPASHPGDTPHRSPASAPAHAPRGYRPRCGIPPQSHRGSRSRR